MMQRVRQTLQNLTADSSVCPDLAVCLKTEDHYGN